jgi:hypothetical protein
MHLSRAIGTAMLSMMLGSVAHASTACDTYHDLGRFGMIARTLLKAGVLGNYICASGSNFDKSICTTKAKLTAFGLEGGFDPSNLVATQPTGAAVFFSHPEAKNPCKDNQIQGDVVTGGGLVLAKGSVPPDIWGITDTTGTSPLLSSCSGARVDMVGAANAIHAAPAVMTLDELKVPADGSTAQLTVPAGGGIVRIGKLSFAGLRSEVRYGYNYECLYSSQYFNSSWLEIVGSSADDIVLDVGELSIGNCAYISMPSDKFMINVAGEGRKIKIGVDTNGDYPINILAPERSVKITGEKAYEMGTYLGFIWADKVLMKGYTWASTLDCEE